MPTDRTTARQKIACTSRPFSSPSACAVSPVVPERRKLKVAKAKSKINVPTARPPSATASPMRPTTAVSVNPSSGVVRNASVIGSVIFQTDAWVTVKGRMRRTSVVAGVLAPPSPAKTVSCRSVMLAPPIPER